jgi:DNA invertase Pin-like site-specific DNA recombinase
MISDCRARRIDMVITKSISRFARNTVTLLEVVRELRSLDVEVYFEKENIHSTSGDGELLLTILASFAQEESLSVSENCKWRIRDKFKEGYLHSTTIIGYRMVDGILEAVPEEAEIVRMIFANYLSGMGKNAIMKSLNAKGCTTRNGKEWMESGVYRILRNEKYVGDLLLQKAYNYDHISKRKTINKGELPMYYVKDSHMLKGTKPSKSNLPKSMNNDLSALLNGNTLLSFLSCSNREMNCSPSLTRDYGIPQWTQLPFTQSTNSHSSSKTAPNCRGKYKDKTNPAGFGSVCRTLRDFFFLASIVR